MPCLGDLEVHTRAVVGSGILVGAVLLTLPTPLRGSVCNDEGSSGQSDSSVRQHVVMLHNSTI